MGRGVKVVSISACYIIYVVVALLVIEVMKHPDVGGMMLCAWLIYLVAPIRHPCDYNSYRAWWEDRRNWGSS